MVSNWHGTGPNGSLCSLPRPAPAESPLERLLDAVLAEQRRDWLKGKPITVSERLRQHPELAADPDGASELIYHEFTLREESGASPDWEEYLRRYPQHAAALRCLRQADQLVEQTLGMPVPQLAGPFPDYEILEEIGRGGMGVIFKARQKSLDRIVALKVMRAWDADVDERKRLDREAQAVAHLQHPNIVQIHEVGEAGGQGFVSLEYVEGASLAHRLDGTPLPAAEAAALVETLARAMHYAHERGIIHRDLKPGNVLLAGALDRSISKCTAKITDFGLARRLDVKSDTQTGAILGTPSYMAPERAEGHTAAPDRRTDVYGLGAILYELLTGRPPFRADTSIQTLKQVVEAEPARPHLLNPSVPRDLETVCLKCLQKEPAGRYATAEGLADDLHRFGEGRPVVARPVSWPERQWRWARRNPLPATLAAVLALAVTAGLTSALALWWNAERHLREEEIARRESEDNYLTCRRLLDEYVAVTRDLHLHNPAGMGQTSLAGPGERPWSALRRREQRAALAKARVFCEGLARRRPDDPALKRVLAAIWTGLAALDAYDGRLDDARQAGETARTLWREVALAVPDFDGRDRLAGVLSTLGFVYGSLGRTVEAADSLRQALVLWDQLGGDGAESLTTLLSACAARRELANRLFYVGGYQPERQRIFEENCSRLEQAMRGDGGPPELRLELVVNLMELAEQHRHEGKLEGSEHCWQRGYELARRLIDEMPSSGEVVYHFAFCCRELAGRNRAAAPPEEIAQLCERATRLLEAQRLRDPTDRDSTQALARVNWMLADSYIQAGQRDKALRSARRAAAVYADLADRHPDDPAARVKVYEDLAQLVDREARCGDASAARSSAQQLADGLEKFCDAGSADIQFLGLVIRTGGAIAPVLRHAGVPDQALRVVQCCLQTSERLVRTYPDEPAYRAGLSEAWTQLGKASSSAQHYEQAEAAYRAAAQVADRLAERWPEYHPMREDRLNRLKRFLDGRREAAASAARAKE